jgi:hypothetical protein
MGATNSFVTSNNSSSSLVIDGKEYNCKGSLSIENNIIKCNGKPHVIIQEKEIPGCKYNNTISLPHEIKIIGNVTTINTTKNVSVHGNVKNLSTSGGNAYISGNVGELDSGGGNVVIDGTVDQSKNQSKISHKGTTYGGDWKRYFGM